MFLSGNGMKKLLHTKTILGYMVEVIRELIANNALVISNPMCYFVLKINP